MGVKVPKEGVPTVYLGTSLSGGWCPMPLPTPPTPRALGKLDGLVWELLLALLGKRSLVARRSLRIGKNNQSETAPTS